MKRVFVIMDDDKKGPQVLRYECPEGADLKGEKGTQMHMREIVAQMIEMEGFSVLVATDLAQVAEVLEVRGEDIGVALVVEQEAGSTNCIRYLERVRAKYGERIVVIGIAETIGCMEQMEALRVSKLLGAPLGIIDIDGIINAVNEYVVR